MKCFASGFKGLQRQLILKQLKLAILYDDGHTRKHTISHHIENKIRRLYIIQLPVMLLIIRRSFLVGNSIFFLHPTMSYVYIV